MSETFQMRLVISIFRLLAFNFGWHVETENVVYPSDQMHPNTLFFTIYQKQQQQRMK